MLRIRNLYHSFGDRKIINGLDLDLEPQKIYCLMGANGSGKTTLFNIITGFLKAKSGDITYKDQSIFNKSPVKINHLGISRTFQDLRMIRELTVRENVMLAFKGNKGENIFQAMLPPPLLKHQNDEFNSRAEEIIERVFLSDVIDQNPDVFR